MATRNEIASGVQERFQKALARVKAGESINAATRAEHMSKNTFRQMNAKSSQPISTKAQPKPGKTPLQISKLPNNQLSKSQRQIKVEWNKARTLSELAALTGMDKTLTQRRLDRANIDYASLRFRPGVGVVAKNRKGVDMFLVALSKGGHTTYMFYSEASYKRFLNGIVSGDEDYDDAATTENTRVLAA